MVWLENQTTKTSKTARNLSSFFGVFEAFAVCILAIDLHL